MHTTYTPTEVATSERAKTEGTIATSAGSVSAGKTPDPRKPQDSISA